MALYEEVAGLRTAGKIKDIGISNVTTDLIRSALAITPVVSVQNRLGPGHPYGRAEIALCEQEGLAFLAYSPLGGLGTKPGPPTGPAASRFTEVARRHGTSPQQIALAWELSLSPAVIPIPGSTRAPTILDSVQAAALTLSPSDLATLGGIQ